MSRKAMLVCGILSSLLYVYTDVLASTLWEGCSFIDQAVSELSAIGAQKRTRDHHASAAVRGMRARHRIWFYAMSGGVGLCPLACR